MEKNHGHWKVTTSTLGLVRVTVDWKSVVRRTLAEILRTMRALRVRSTARSLWSLRQRSMPPAQRPWPAPAHPASRRALQLRPIVCTRAAEQLVRCATNAVKELQCIGCTRETFSDLFWEKP